MAKVKKVGEIYRCEICGNVVEVKEVGGTALIFRAVNLSSEK